MSFALDVNLLLYASDTESSLHERARVFLESCMRGGELFCLGLPTVMGYLRIATHPSLRFYFLYLQLHSPDRSRPPRQRPTSRHF